MKLTIWNYQTINCQHKAGKHEITNTGTGKQESDKHESAKQNESHTGTTYEICYIIIVYNTLHSVVLSQNGYFQQELHKDLIIWKLSNTPVNLWFFKGLFLYNKFPFLNFVIWI